MGKKVVAIVGTYRKGRIIDTAVDEILKGARAGGAETVKIDLIDKHIEFCTNCRACMQQEGRGRPGECVHDDDMAAILAEIDSADAVVLASPINLGRVTALMKRFVERLGVLAYWPWGVAAPKHRIAPANKKALTVVSSACPAFLGRIIMPAPLRLLKYAAKFMGAKVQKSLYFGLAAGSKDAKLSEKSLRKAYKAGEGLVG